MNRGQWQFLGLALLFFGPLALAFWLYYAGGWRPQGMTNHGDLITPARPLPTLALRLAGGAPAPASLLHDQWTLVYVGDGACPADCQMALYSMRQTRLSLANDATRVRRVFLAAGNCCNGDFFAREHPGLEVIDATGAEAQPLLALFPPRAASGANYTLYIVDPLGNLMMQHDGRTPSRGMLDDLKKLLKLSHIG
jgi:hypothetical protein